MRVLVCVCARVRVCVCVCESERERERAREKRCKKDLRYMKYVVFEILYFSSDFTYLSLLLTQAAQLRLINF